MDLKTVVGNAATVCTIGLFLTGFQICQKIWSKRSTVDISALPFICGLMSCSLWLRYGVYVHDSSLITVNLVGGILQVLYLMCYCTFAVNRSTFYWQLTMALSILGFLFLYTAYCTSNIETSVKISGLAASGGAVIFMSSPLASLAHVVKTRSVESLPFPMILFSFIMASLWVWYGILLSDTFIQMPNLLGAVVSACQLCLFVIYPSKKTFYEVNLA